MASAWCVLLGWPSQAPFAQVAAWPPQTPSAAPAVAGRATPALRAQLRDPLSVSRELLRFTCGDATATTAASPDAAPRIIFVERIGASPVALWLPDAAAAEPLPAHTRLALPAGSSLYVDGVTLVCAELDAPTLAAAGCAVGAPYVPAACIADTRGTGRRTTTTAGAASGRTVVVVDADTSPRDRASSSDDDTGGANARDSSQTDAAASLSADRVATAPSASQTRRRLTFQTTLSVSQQQPSGVVLAASSPGGSRRPKRGRQASASLAEDELDLLPAAALMQPPPLPAAPCSGDSSSVGGSLGALDDVLGGMDASIGVVPLMPRASTGTASVFGAAESLGARRVSKASVAGPAALPGVTCTLNGPAAGTQFGVESQIVLFDQK